MKKLKLAFNTKCGKPMMVLENKDAMGCGGNEIIQPLEIKNDETKFEKHLPVVEVKGDKVIVTVGSVLHPMTEEHQISFIILETEKGVQVKYLEPGDAPVAEFCLNGEKAVAAYEYCNLHGLFQTLI